MFSLQNKTKARLPKFDWLSVKNSVLGSKYELSLVFCGKAISRDLNKKYRNKNKPTNVLSFPNSKTSGEIFLDIDTAKAEALELKKPLNKWLPYLYIHGLFHLSGLDHGEKMDASEARFIKQYKL